MVAYTYTPAAGETSRYFRLDVQKSELVIADFKKGTSGWVFFSVPTTPQIADPFVNLGDDIDPLKVYWYDTESSGYKVYPLDLGEVSLRPGRGYFTYLQKDAVVDIGGAVNREDVALELGAAGFHAIGNPFVLPVNIKDLLVNGKSFDKAVEQGLVSGTLYRWKLSVAPGGAADADVSVSSGAALQPWKGYWLETKVKGITLTMPAPLNGSFPLDTESPTSTVISANANSPTVTVKWAGLDDSSGVKWYDIQYKDGPKGAWSNWLVGTTSTSAVFPGEYGHTYYFQSRAQDNARNWEGYPGGNGDVSITPKPTTSATASANAAPALTVTSPNGGESWTIGSMATIAWSSSDVNGTVGIDLSRDGGQTWSSIVRRSPNDGSYTWNVKGPATAQARVRVTSTSTPAASDASNANFAISDTNGASNQNQAANNAANNAAPALTVTSPNGGERWTIGSMATIAWTSSGLDGSVGVDLSRDGGQTWISIVRRSPNDGSYTWNVKG
ncbi:MAG: hypothetical protein AAB502_02235, partial [Chloroflexota bacterium]